MNGSTNGYHALASGEGEGNEGEIEAWVAEADPRFGEEEDVEDRGEAGKAGKWVWQKGRRNAANDTPCPSPSKFFDRRSSLRPRDLIDPLLAGEGREDGGEEKRLLAGWNRIGTEAWKRRVSMAFVCFLVLVGDGNRGLVLPTLQGYIGKFGGTSGDVGLANAGFSLGRLIAAPLFGYWMDQRNTGEVLLFSMVVCAVCNFFYTYASYACICMPVSPAVVIIVSRACLGFGASILGVGRAYIAKQTSKAERGPYIAILCALQYVSHSTCFFPRPDSLSKSILTLASSTVGVGSYLFLRVRRFLRPASPSPHLSA